MDHKPPKDVYSIINQAAGNSRWMKIGTAFVNQDDSLNVLLDALPVNGKIHIRDAKQSSPNNQRRNYERKQK